LLTSAIASGLKLLRTALRTDDPGELSELMQKNTTTPMNNYNTIDEVSTQSTQDVRRTRYPDNHHDDLEIARQKLPVVGDMEDAPPLCWVIIWRGTYCNTYGGMITELLQGWGYIFWGAPQLMRSGGKRMIQLEWSATWNPRDLWLQLP
jgi:hypothetical protein